MNGMKLGRVYRIKQSDVNSFLEERMIHPTETPKEASPQKIEKKEQVKKGKRKDPDKNHYYII